jgi:hypothetical protein
MCSTRSCGCSTRACASRDSSASRRWRGRLAYATADYRRSRFHWVRGRRPGTQRIVGGAHRTLRGPNPSTIATGLRPSNAAGGDALLHHRPWQGQPCHRVAARSVGRTEGSQSDVRRQRRVESAMSRGQACHADSGGGSSTHRTGLTTIGDATVWTYCRTQRGSSRPAGLALIPTQAARMACISEGCGSRRYGRM